MLDLTKQPASSKQQILKGIYEENLVVAGKKKPDFTYRRRSDSAAAPQRHASYYIFLLLIVSAAVAYSALISYWGYQQEDQLQVSTNDFATEAGHNHSAATANLVAKTEPRLTSVETAGTVPLVESQLDDVILKMYLQKQPSAPAEEASPEAIEQLQDLASPDVPLAKLFGLGVHTIVIDPGHGGKDPGAVGQLGSYEKDITLAISQRLRDRLQAQGNYNVLLTRETDEFLGLNERVKFANENQADLFISIHINYFPSNRVNFVETYYFGPNSDKKVAELAARENADSNYLYAEFKQMVKKVSDTMKFQESKDLAESVQQNLFTEISQVNTKAKNHGIKPGPFVVLLGIDAPSILTEVTSLNNKQEEQRLKSPAYRDKIAMFLEKGIVNYLNKSTIRPGGGRNGEEKENLAQAQDNY